MKKRSLWSRAGSFVLGKGFYMVLLLCVMAIGGSGYYLYSLAHTALSPATVSAPAHVEVDTPAPAAHQPVEQTPRASLPQEVEVPVPAAESSAPVEQVPSPEPEQTPAAQQSPEAAPAAEADSPATEPQAPACFAPVEGEAVAAFSATELTYNAALGDWRTHNGVDLSAELGEGVCAMQEGEVLTVSNDLLLGTTVTLNHGDGLMSVYANLDPEVDVEQGQRVSAGQRIGTVGQTAMGERNEGCWLHFAVLKDSEAVDPMEYLESKELLRN